MLRPETKLLILLSSFIVFVWSVRQPLEDEDATGQLKELINHERQHFEKMLQKQAEGFEEKLRQQDKKFKGEIDDMKSTIRHLKEQLDKEKAETALRESLSKNSHADEQIEKRSDDTDPLEIVVSQVSQRLDDVTAEIQTLKNQDQSLINDITEAKGTVYVRWGSSTCGNTTQLVYTGIIGGSHFDQPGSPTNALCLPLHPVYPATSQGSSVIYGFPHIYGGEYEVKPEPSHDLDAVCVVCRTARATTVMIPATSTCQPGWNLEYSGYIMAGYPDPQQTRSGSEFICVDWRMEGLTGSKENDNGFVLYYTKGHCGSLPCPPYVEDKVLPCVVCSQ